MVPVLDQRRTWNHARKPVQKNKAFCRVNDNERTVPNMVELSTEDMGIQRRIRIYRASNSRWVFLFERLRDQWTQRVFFLRAKRRNWKDAKSSWFNRPLFRSWFDVHIMYFRVHSLSLRSAGTMRTTLPTLSRTSPLRVDRAIVFLKFCCSSANSDWQCFEAHTTFD